MYLFIYSFTYYEKLRLCTHRRRPDKTRLTCGTYDKRYDNRYDNRYEFL